MVENEAAAKRVYASLSNALDKFLKNVVLEYSGCIPFDLSLQKAVRNRSILLDTIPGTPAGDSMATLARRLVNDGRTNHSEGNLTFFMNRVFDAVQ